MCERRDGLVYVLKLVHTRQWSICNFSIFLSLLLPTFSPSPFAVNEKKDKVFAFCLCVWVPINTHLEYCLLSSYLSSLSRAVLCYVMYFSVILNLMQCTRVATAARERKFFLHILAVTHSWKRLCCLSRKVSFRRWGSEEIKKSFKLQNIFFYLLNNN